ncbi:hypothetical protein SLE2022_099170 [Rubroshorea leprosula]
MENLMIPSSASRRLVIIPPKQESLEGRLSECITTLDAISKTGSKVRANNFSNLLQSCIDYGSVDLGRQLHSRIDLVDKMRERNLYTWSAMIGACSREQSWRKVVELFFLMMNDGMVPDDFLFPKILEACANCGDVVTGKLIHSLVIRLGMLGQCDVAMGLMKEMESFGITPDVFTWTSMISGLAQNGRTDQALDLFKEMLLEGVTANDVTIVSAISACTSSRGLKTGWKFVLLLLRWVSLMKWRLGIPSLARILGTGKQKLLGKVLTESKVGKDVFTWNSMIGGYSQAGYCGKAYELFMKMQDSNVKPDVIMWNAMIYGYTKNGDEDQAINLFQQMEKDGKIKQNAASWNSLIAGCVQLGEKDKALVTILSVLPACADYLIAAKKNVNLRYWNSIVGGYVLHGFSDATLHLVSQMTESGLKPNRATFSSIILAHGIVGMVDEGGQVFSSITDNYGIIPSAEHYSSMIDLYGHSGRVGEAIKFIEDVPTETDSSICASLLTASRMHGNIGLTVLAGEHLLNLEPGNILIQRLMLQIYAFCGKLEDTSKSRPCSGVLYSWVQTTAKNLKINDYHDGFSIEEEEKEEIGGVHSEKLALAFALIGSPSVPKRIRIVKNMRMCGNCHKTAKYLSMTYGCEIFLTDTKSFHHFKNGHCSCGDY